MSLRHTEVSFLLDSESVFLPLPLGTGLPPPLCVDYMCLSVSVCPVVVLGCLFLKVLVLCLPACWMNVYMLRTHRMFVLSDGCLPLAATTWSMPVSVYRVPCQVPVVLGPICSAAGLIWDFLVVGG